jgi:Restriction endonuclease
MFDVFTEEIEVQIKKGISNLYWYLGDLEKAWLRAGVDKSLTTRLFGERSEEGKKLTKRELMDLLYRNIREIDFNRRLEISRNFVRFLVEHKNFVPANENHRVNIAETSALKLREMIENQRVTAESKQFRKDIQKKASFDYYDELSKLKDEFVRIQQLVGPPRGYAFEKFFTSLMKLSGIPVHEPFRIVGEQIDGAIQYCNHHYLIELKWEKSKAAHTDVSSLYLKVEGKLGARGIFIAMEGYSDQVLLSLPKGKKLNLLLLDGVHVANVVFGLHTFDQLLQHSLTCASVKGELYCSHEIAC